MGILCKNTAQNNSVMDALFTINRKKLLLLAVSAIFVTQVTFASRGNQTLCKIKTLLVNSLRVIQLVNVK